MDIVFCGRKKFAEYAQRYYNWLPGSRSDHIVTNGYTLDDKLEFIDAPFKFKEWERHKEEYFERISHYRPSYAIAPDIYSWEEFDEKMEVAERIHALGIKTIVVPKVRGMVVKVDEKFILGWPLGSKYSDILLDEFELYSTRLRIHILGGTPRKQMSFIMYHPNVVSLDGNSFVKVAQKFRQAYDEKLNNISMCGEIHSNEIVFRSIDGIGTFWQSFRR